MKRQGAPEAVVKLRRELARRGIDCVYCPDGQAALELLRSRIPAGATVMNGGSSTLKQIGFLAALENGPYRWLRPGVAAIADPEERIRGAPRRAARNGVARGTGSLRELRAQARPGAARRPRRLARGHSSPSRPADCAGHGMDLALGSGG